MTTASTNTADERIEFSTDYGTVYLTGKELAQIEADEYLTPEAVVRHRAGGDDE